MRKLVFAWLSLLGLSCADGRADQEPVSRGRGCAGDTLADLCSNKCPRSTADAIERVCEGARIHYAIADNDCGGKTVSTPDRFTRSPPGENAQYHSVAGTRYYFDANGTLIGGSRWSDSLDRACRLPEFYGEECKPTSSGALMDCSFTVTAAERP